MDNACRSNLYRMSEQNRFPGFDGLRLGAAAAVMFSHSFLIATGGEHGEPLTRLLGPGHVLGLYSVFTFFIISGFLLSRSISTTPSATTFIVNRGLRIVPGFVFCVVATAFVIGPLFSRLTVHEYFRSEPLYSSVATSLQTWQDGELPGLFSYPDGEGLQTVVNGSLWSLRYEALSYVFLLLVWTVVRRQTALAAVLSVVALAAAVYPDARVYTSLAFTLPYFAAGVAMHSFYERFGTSVTGALIAAGLLVAAGAVGWQLFAFAPLGAYLVVFIGERPNPGSSMARRIGDCSYGLYLFGWPAEQMVKQVTFTNSPLVVFALAVPLALGCALISYHLVEAPAMRLRHRVASRVDMGFAWFLDRMGRAREAALYGARLSFAVAAASILAVGPWWLVVNSLLHVMVWTLIGSATAALAYQGVVGVRSWTTADR